MLAPSDYGAVVALTTIYSVFEIVADVGLDRFVTINTGSRRAQAVRTAQQISLIRGIFVGVMIVVCAPWLASLFGAGDRLGSIRWLALLQ